MGQTVSQKQSCMVPQYLTTMQQQPENSMGNIIPDIWLVVCKFLDKKSILLHFARVCKRACAIAWNDKLWLPHVYGNQVPLNQAYAFYKQCVYHVYDTNLVKSKHMHLTARNVHITGDFAATVKCQNSYVAGHVYFFSIQVADCMMYHNYNCWSSIGIVEPQFPSTSRIADNNNGYALDLLHLRTYHNTSIHNMSQNGIELDITPKYQNICDPQRILTMVIDMRHANPQSDTVLQSYYAQHGASKCHVASQAEMSDKDHILNCNGTKMCFFLDNTLLGFAFHGIQGQAFCPAVYLSYAFSINIVSTSDAVISMYK